MNGPKWLNREYLYSTYCDKLVEADESVYSNTQANCRECLIMVVEKMKREIFAIELRMNLPPSFGPSPIPAKDTSSLTVCLPDLPTSDETRVEGTLPEPCENADSPGDIPVSLSHVQDPELEV